MENLRRLQQNNCDYLLTDQLRCYIAHVLWRHRNSQLIATPPRAIQRIVFPVILFIGRVLGKYRGSSWPGSPESCPGAPLVDAANV